MADTDDPDIEEELAGGLGSGGAVVRVGDTVRRPNRPFSASVRSFLAHLHTVGFEAAPTPLGVDRLGREMLSFVPGEVAIPPFPGWAASEELLDSVARLQASMHRAAASYLIPADAVWDRANLPAPAPDAIVCHNDLCVENVVVRDGRAAAFIDFDFAAPADPLYDIAIAARHWVPIKQPIDRSPQWADLDARARFDRFLDAHCLAAAQRITVVEHLGEFLDRALISMRQRAEAGQPGYVDIWAAGYAEQNRRSRQFCSTL